MKVSDTYYSLFHAPTVALTATLQIKVLTLCSRLPGLEIACVYCSSHHFCMRVLAFVTSEQSVVQDFRSELVRHLRAHVQARYMQTWLVCFSLQPAEWVTKLST